MDILTHEARFLQLMDVLPVSFIKKQYIKKILFEKYRRQDGIEKLTEDGFERVEVPSDTMVLEDGRPVFRAFDVVWALRMEEHLKRVHAAFQEEKERKKEAPTQEETKSVVGTESLSVLVCNKCGDSLQHTKICPACSAGVLGYRHRYTCACGKTDIISKESVE